MWPSGVVATLELALGAGASARTGTGACGSYGSYETVKIRGKLVTFY